PIVERFQIDLVAVDVRLRVVERLRGGVAVRDERRAQPEPSRVPEDLDRPLERDQRLVVGRDDQPRAEVRGLPRQAGRVDVARRHDGPGIAQRLRRHPVLAVTAVQVAAQHAEAEREAAGGDVEEGLLLDGVALDAADVTPGRVERAAAIEADLAHARGAVGQRAPVAARHAPDPSVVDGLDERGRPDGRLENILERHVRLYPGGGASIGPRAGPRQRRCAGGGTPGAAAAPPPFSGDWNTFIASAIMLPTSATFAGSTRVLLEPTSL